MRGWVGPGAVERANFLQKFGCRLAGFQGRKFFSQFEYGGGAGAAEGLLRAGRPLQVGSQYGQTGPGGEQQDQRVTEIVVGKDVVAGAARQFAQVGQDFRGLVNAQNRETGVLGVRRAACRR